MPATTRRRTSRRKARASGTSRAVQGTPDNGRPVLPPPPSREVPSDAALRTDFLELPGYKLLALYLEWFPVQLPILLRSLSELDQHCAWEAWKRDRSERLSAQQKAVEIYSSMSVAERARIPPETRRRRDRTAGPSLTVLTTAWLLTERDNNQTRKTQPVMDFIEKSLCRQRGLSIDKVLRSSYVPRQILELADVYRFQQMDGKTLGNSIRKLRQLQIHDLPIPEDLDVLDPVSREQERQRWKQLGLGRTLTQTSQPFWTAFFPPLVDTLLEGTQLDSLGGAWLASHRAACRDASHVVHLRYPDLWPDKPDLVRRRYLRSF